MHSSNEQLCLSYAEQPRTWHDAVTNCETKDMILYTWTGSLISFPYARGFWSGGPLHQTGAHLFYQYRNVATATTKGNNRWNLWSI